VKSGHEVVAEAINQQLGRLELDRLKQSLMGERDTDLISARANVAGLHAPYVTREGLRQELSAIEIVNTGRGACAPLGVMRIPPDSKLSPDQRQAVTTLLHSTDRICALRGVAGTGKTTTLQEVQRGLQALQRTVFTCAPTTSAAEVLRKEGFSNATTLSDFLQNAEKNHGAQLRRATFIVDEAGIASTRQGAELCELVKRHDARLILVGDTRQHSGVEAGDFLSVLENHSRLQTCELTDIRRQTEQAYRSAVKSMAQGQARIGLMAIDKLGRLHEAGADYIKRAAEDYVADLAAKKNTLLVAPTWDEIHRLTDHVRDSMKKRGMLGSGESVRVAEPLAWTKAQQQRSANYQPGHFLSLHRPIAPLNLKAGTTAPLNLKAGTTLEVTAVIRGRITVRAPDGRDVMLTPRQQSGAWSVAAVRVAEFAAGDRILIRQNHRAAGLVNGEVLTLESRAPSGAWNTRNTEGQAKVIPADFRAFTHGYAITSHKSQGRTCDRVIVCAAQLDAKATYVAFSRARQEAVGYTPVKAALLERLPEVNRSRLAAVDFLPMLRPRRLRWVRAVIERVREMLSPRAAPVAPAITPAVDAPANAQKPPVPALKVSTPESLLAPWPPHQSPRQGMRMSM
jgi:ATP-dependent exoDNAse (exonuclease V) alpha subunit